MVSNSHFEEWPQQNTAARRSGSAGPLFKVGTAAEYLHDARAKERAACIPEAIHLYEASISAAERGNERAVLAEALRRLAVVLHHRNESARARDFCNRSFKVACALGNDILAAEALNTMGGLAVRTGEIEEARSYFQQALERGGESREIRARVELNLGVLANIRGQLVEAVRHYERAVEAYRATNAGRTATSARASRSRSGPATCTCRACAS